MNLWIILQTTPHRRTYQAVDEANCITNVVTQIPSSHTRPRLRQGRRRKAQTHTPLPHEPSFSQRPSDSAVTKRTISRWSRHELQAKKAAHYVIHLAWSTPATDLQLFCRFKDTSLIQTSTSTAAQWCAFFLYQYSKNKSDQNQLKTPFCERKKKSPTQTRPHFYHSEKQAQTTRWATEDADAGIVAGGGGTKALLRRCCDLAKTR